MEDLRARSLPKSFLMAAKIWVSEGHRNREEQPERHVGDRTGDEEQQVVFVFELGEEVAVHALDALDVQVVRHQLDLEEHEHELHVEVHEAC